MRCPVFVGRCGELELIVRLVADAGDGRGGWMTDRALPAALLQHGITAREAEVLDLVGDRLGNKEIAARLYLSPRTVEKHVASLLTKLDADDRAALIDIARDH